MFRNVGTKFHPKVRTQLSEHGESLESRTLKIFLNFCNFYLPECTRLRNVEKATNDFDSFHFLSEEAISFCVNN